MTYDQRHGGPFDRGGADYWYGRPFRPHYFEGGTYQSEEITDLDADQVAAYRAGYAAAEAQGDQKDWG